MKNSSPNLEYKKLLVILALGWSWELYDSNEMTLMSFLSRSHATYLWLIMYMWVNNTVPIFIVKLQKFLAYIFKIEYIHRSRHIK